MTYTLKELQDALNAFKEKNDYILEAIIREEYFSQALTRGILDCNVKINHNLYVAEQLMGVDIGKILTDFFYCYTPLGVKVNINIHLIDCD